MSPAQRSNPSRSIERVAAAFVRSWVSNRGVVTDTGLGHGPDFHIAYHDGRRAIGEVGWHEDPDIQAMWAHIHRHSPAQQIDLPDGLGQWSVRLRAGARLTRLRHELPPLIASLQQAGRDHIVAADNWPVDDLTNQTARLGIESLRQISNREPSLAIYSPPGKGGVIPDDPDIICDWITEVVTDPRYLDMTGKLQHDDADERHIFIATGTLTGIGVEERVRLIHEHRPSRSPDLPQWITHAWVLSLFGSTSAGLWSRVDGWTSITLTTAELERLGTSSRT